MIQLGTERLAAASLAQTKERQVETIDQNEALILNRTREVGQTLSILAKTAHLRRLEADIRFNQTRVTACLSGLPKGAKSEFFIELLCRYYGDRLTLTHYAAAPNELTAEIMLEETKPVKTTSPLHTLYKYGKIQVRD